MNKKRRFRMLSFVLSFVIIFFTIHPSAYAGMVNTGAIVAEQQSTQAREYIATLLEREDVQARMVALGVDPEMTKMRVAALSDDEVQSLADKIEQLPAGGQIGSIIGAALVVFIVLVITDILGYTDVFPFIIKKAR